MLSTFTVWNTADDGEGSLRWAIVQANEDDGPTRIEFDIPGDGARTIRLNAALDPLIRPVVIDGRAQPGYAGRPLIGLDGSGLANGENGLVISGGDSLIAGLFITGFPGAGIVLTGGAGNLVESCHVGVDSSGGRAAPNAEGVVILGSSHNVIGGGGGSVGNLISGNAGAGIRISNAAGETVGNRIVGNRIGTDLQGSTAIGNQSGGVVIAGGREGLIADNLISGNRGAGLSLIGWATDNVVVGNAIGLTADGARRLGNLGDGVLLESAPGNRIGGLSEEEANQISGNQGSGVRTRVDSAGLILQGNQIGTDASGTLALGNAGDGVSLGTSFNMIGGESSGAGNLIAHNGVGSVGSGVRLIGQVDHNSILSNVIHDNAGLGINFGRGPTPNHAPGDEPGPNNWQNYPILSRALYDGTSARATGKLFGAPSQTHLIQLFQSGRPDPSGFGEGERHLGSLRVVTDSTGEATFTIVAPMEIAGGYLSATATDPNGNTSEFSRVLLALPSTDLNVSMAAAPAQAKPGAPITFTATVTNRGGLDANRVVLSVQFPSTATVVSATSTRGGTTLGDGATVSAEVGPLGPNESAILVVVVQPGADFVGDFSGTARATMDETDIRPEDNAVTASVSIAPPVKIPPADPVRLSLNLRPPEVVHERSTFQYALVVANASARDAADVALTAPLPSGLEFVSASTSWGSAPILDSGRVVATLESLSAGGTATLTILVRPTTSAGAELLLSGGLACPDFEPTPGADSATFAARVQPAVDLMVRLRPQQNSIQRGGGVYWIADVWNSGPSAASGVVLRLPTTGAGGVLAATSTRGTIQTTSDGMTVFFGTIAPGSYATAAALLSPKSLGLVSLLATVAADQHDLNPADNASGATLSVLDWPGSIQFGSSALVVPETIGVAIIPVERSGGSLGTASVHYRTTGGSAIPGVDYQPIAGVLTFGPGETLGYVSVPIFAHPHGKGDAAVGLILEAPSAGAVLGERKILHVTIRDLDPDLSPPEVAAVHLAGGPNAITSLAITFSEPLDPGLAHHGPAYRLVDLGPSGIPGSADNQALGLYPPSYDPATRTVTLTPLAPLAAGRNYAIVLVGAGPSALTDLAGNPLAGNSDGIGGVDYISIFARGPSLNYTDSKGNPVSLRAAGGGFLDLTRTLAGDARVLTLQEGVPGRTTLSGSVLRQRGRGDGVTVIDAIEGLGQFGQIRVTLQSPPFLIKRLPFGLTAGRPLPAPRPIAPPRGPAPIRRPPPPMPPARPPLPVRQPIAAPRILARGAFAMRRF